MDSISGFKILPVTLPGLKLKTVDFSKITSNPISAENVQETTAIHYIYMKKHDAKNDESFPRKRTLFLSNIPVSTTINHLRRLFRKCGVIENVIWRHEKTVNDILKINISNSQDYHMKTGATCHVVFAEEESVEFCLAMKARKRIWSSVLDEDQLQELGIEQEDQLFGISSIFITNSEYKQLQKSRLLDHDLLQQQVDEHIKAFKVAQEEERRARIAKRNQPDEDGFVTVTRARGRRNTNRDASGATVTAANPHEIKNLKPKNKELKNFYRFQIREAKRQGLFVIIVDLAELRAKFEQDKKKIEALKSKRRFKPF